MTTFLLFDRRRAVRSVMAQRLAGAVAGCEPDGENSVECVADPNEVVPCYQRQPARLVLVGTERADRTGLHVTRTLLAVCPAAAVVVLGAPGDDTMGAAALAAGARGFLLWNDLLAATGLARDRGHALLAVTAVFPCTGAVSTDDTASTGTGSRLSERETQILRGMSRGLSNVAIGRELYVAEDTVKTHARRLFRKLGVFDRAAAVAAGFRAGVLQ